MNDRSGADSAKTADVIQPVELVWGSSRWPRRPVDARRVGRRCTRCAAPPSEVGDLYGAAAAEPPLNEDRKYALLFADVYEASVRKGQVLAALARSAEDGRLRAIAYGHFWAWAEQAYEWAYELRESSATPRPSSNGRSPSTSSPGIPASGPPGSGDAPSSPGRAESPATAAGSRPTISTARLAASTEASASPPSDTGRRPQRRARPRHVPSAAMMTF